MGISLTPWGGNSTAGPGPSGGPGGPAEAIRSDGWEVGLGQAGQVLTGIANLVYSHDVANSQLAGQKLSQEMDFKKNEIEQRLMSSTVPPTDWAGIIKTELSDFGKSKLGSFPIGKLADQYYYSKMGEIAADQGRIFGLESAANKNHILSETKKAQAEVANGGDYNAIVSRLSSKFVDPATKAPTRGSVMAFGPNEGEQIQAYTSAVAMIKTTKIMADSQAETDRFMIAASQSGKPLYNEITGVEEKSEIRRIELFDKTETSKIPSLNNAISRLTKGISLLGGDNSAPVSGEMAAFGSTVGDLKVKLMQLEAERASITMSREEILSGSSKSYFSDVLNAATQLANRSGIEGNKGVEYENLGNYASEMLHHLTDPKSQMYKGMTEKDRVALIKELEVMKATGTATAGAKFEAQLAMFSDALLADEVKDKPLHVRELQDQLHKKYGAEFKERIDAWASAVVNRERHLEGSYGQLRDKTLSEIRGELVQRGLKDKDLSDAMFDAEKAVEVWTNATRKGIGTVSVDGYKINPSQAFLTSREDTLDQVKRDFLSGKVPPNGPKPDEKSIYTYEEKDFTDVFSRQDKQTLSEMKGFAAEGFKEHLFAKSQGVPQDFANVLRDPNMKVADVVEKGTLSIGGKIYAGKIIRISGNNKNMELIAVSVVAPFRKTSGNANSENDQRGKSDWDVRDQPATLYIDRNTRRPVGIIPLSANADQLGLVLSTANPSSSNGLGKAPVGNLRIPPKPVGETTLDYLTQMLVKK